MPGSARTLGTKSAITCRAGVGQARELDPKELFHECGGALQRTGTQVSVMSELSSMVENIDKVSRYLRIVEEDMRKLCVTTCRSTLRNTVDVIVDGCTMVDKSA